MVCRRYAMSRLGSREWQKANHRLVKLVDILLSANQAIRLQSSLFNFGFYIPRLYIGFSDLCVETGSFFDTLGRFASRVQATKCRYAPRRCIRKSDQDQPPPMIQAQIRGYFG